MAVSPFGMAPEQALAALRARGLQLDPSFAWQDVYGEIHGRMLTVAKSAGFDILKDVYDGLVAALKDGKSPKAFAADLTPILKAKGWWGRQAVTDPETGETVMAQLGSPRRLRLIYDVNMRVSYAAGAWTRFERARRERPFLRYVAIMDLRTRPEHAARNNVCLPIDDPFWETWAPPCGWNCRCTLQNLSQADVDRMRDRLKFEAPADKMRDWTNKRTGEVVRLPAGIDPGWGHNPGKAGWTGAMGIGDKLIDAPPRLAAVAGNDVAIQAALETQYRSWLPTALEATTATSRSSLAVLGTLSNDTQNALAKPVASAAIALTAVRARNLAKRLGRDGTVTEARSQLMGLPAFIATPDAVLRARRSGLVVYVRLAGRHSTIVLVRPVSGAPQRAAEILGVTTVDTADLLDGDRYQLLYGTIR